MDLFFTQDFRSIHTSKAAHYGGRRWKTEETWTSLKFGAREKWWANFSRRIWIRTNFKTWAHHGGRGFVINPSKTSLTKLRARMAGLSASNYPVDTRTWRTLRGSKAVHYGGKRRDAEEAIRLKTRTYTQNQEIFCVLGDNLISSKFLQPFRYIIVSPCEI